MKFACLISGFLRTFPYNIDKIISLFNKYEIDYYLHISNQENEDEYKNKKIDFLDLDVEGADLESLKSLDFSRYEPEMICVEIVDKNQPIKHNNLKNSNIYNFLMSKNYKRIWSGMFNHIFVIKK